MGAEPKRISIEEARRLVFAQLTRLEGEEVDLADALGRVLAQDAVAPDDLPPFHSSAMDGFAVIAVDTDDAPVALKVIGESARARWPRRPSRMAPRSASRPAPSSPRAPTPSCARS